MTLDIRQYRGVRQEAAPNQPFGKNVRSGYWQTPKADKEAQKERARYVDSNVDKDDVKEILLIGITAKDYDALQVLAKHNPRVKNYGVLVRRLIQAEAKRLA
jgi:hypothetical protein